ncbi:MAG: PAS domain S-box protein [Deltaproteobacteria bacterium]|nr:PAS domain S-box protein [Deltaproteobacteria bacterium]
MKSIKLKLLTFVSIIVIICALLSLYRIYNAATSNIENLVKQQLRLALNFDLAIREYAAETIRPLMFNFVPESQFIPEVMSTSFIARHIFEKVTQKFPDYIIKFASVNPRNPLNQAGPEELNMIDYFNENPDNEIWTGETIIGGRKYLATFSAMRMEKACLRCHGDPADAPYELIERYGADRSFYRPLGEVVGLDTVAIPSDIIKELSSKEKFKHIGFVGTVILFLSASLMLVFKFIITDRLTLITNHFLNAEKQSGKLKIRSVEIKGGDEIAILATSFNELAKKLNKKYIELTFEIERRNQVQKSLQESESRLRSVIDNAPIIIWAFDQKGKFTFSKGRFLDKLGFHPKVVVGRSVFDIYANNEQIVSDAHRALTGEMFSSVTEVENIVFESRYSPIKDDRGSVTGTIVVTIDITERKKAEIALHESEEKYRKLFEMESDALALMDVDTGNMLDVNSAFTKLYGYSKEEILCMKHIDFSSEPDRTIKSIQGHRNYIPLRYHKKKNGTVFPVEITTNTYEYKERKVLIAAVRDITDRKIIEKQMEASIKIKKILLSEIHHRVKNNFEIISSLLDMSSMQAKNKETQDLLLDSRSRIHSMALIHSQLYQSDRFDRIDMTRYITDLAEHLLFAYGGERKVNLAIEPSGVFLSISQAIPCALVLNELITNSLKHAFRDRAQGKIGISIHDSDDNTVQLRVSDNGTGITEGIDVKPGGGLGIEVVKHLVAGQLKGEMRINHDDGTDICIEFKRPE